MKSKSLPDNLIANYLVEHFQALRVSFPSDVILSDYKLSVKLSEYSSNE